MAIEIKEAGIEESDLLAGLFSAHLDEQCRMDPAAVRQSAFNPADFIEAMLNPTLNKFYAAWDGDKMVGFIRLGILSGDGLLVLDHKIDRGRGSYLRRLPVSILKKIDIMIESAIARMESRNSAFSMLLTQITGYIADIYILPEYRRMKIGSMFVGKATEWFRSMDVDAVELNVLGANDAGRSFWRRMGFQDRRILARKTISK